MQVTNNFKMHTLISHWDQIWLSTKRPYKGKNVLSKKKWLFQVNCKKNHFICLVVCVHLNIHKALPKFVGFAHREETIHLCKDLDLGIKILLTHWPMWRWQVFTKWKFSNGCNFSCLGGCNPKYIRIVYCNTNGFFCWISLWILLHLHDKAFLKHVRV